LVIFFSKKTIILIFIVFGLLFLFNFFFLKKKKKKSPSRYKNKELSKVIATLLVLQLDPNFNSSSFLSDLEMCILCLVDMIPEDSWKESVFFLHFFFLFSFFFFLEFFFSKF